ncbi:hypothetical protein ACFE04_019391 [Oxalis oulophora]
MDVIFVKSEFEAEFRRFMIKRNEMTMYQDFRMFVNTIHKLNEIQFLISYVDKDGDILPINNDDNYARALSVAEPLLRLILRRKGEYMEESNGYGNAKHKNFIASILDRTPGKSRSHPWISNPQDFRQSDNEWFRLFPKLSVSAIIDVDIVPETCRRVRLLKHGSDQPLGFYIRDGTSVRVTPSGMEKVPSIFISRLVPGGIAESTGLLAVNDEVLEVNGIEVAGKSLDQNYHPIENEGIPKWKMKISLTHLRSELEACTLSENRVTSGLNLVNCEKNEFVFTVRRTHHHQQVGDMMEANSSNLIITVKPANQKTTLSVPRRGSISRSSQVSAGSAQSAITTSNTSDDEEDEVVNFT